MPGIAAAAPGPDGAVRGQRQVVLLAGADGARDQMVGALHAPRREALKRPQPIAECDVSVLLHSRHGLVWTVGRPSDETGACSETDVPLLWVLDTQRTRDF